MYTAQKEKESVLGYMAYLLMVVLIVWAFYEIWLSATNHLNESGYRVYIGSISATSDYTSSKDDDEDEVDSRTEIASAPVSKWYINAPCSPDSTGWECTLSTPIRL